MTELDKKVKMINFSKATEEYNRKFYDLYCNKSLTDCMLSADGKFVSCHRVVLSVASSWFDELFDCLPPEKQPVIVLKDISINLLHKIIEFIYLGSTEIPEDEAYYFKSALNSLRISLDEEDMESSMESFDESDLPRSLLDEQFTAVSEKKSEEPEVKPEPNWSDIVIKEEPQEPATVTEINQKAKSPIKVKLPPSIQLKSPSTLPKISAVGSIVTKYLPNSSTPVIRIRTPASINEKAQSEVTPKKTLKLVQRLPQSLGLPKVLKIQDQTTPRPSTSTQNIDQLKRLSKAILVRRVKKSDGSFVSQRAPIKVIQGLKIHKMPSNSNAPGTSQTLKSPDKKLPVFRCSHCNKAFSVNKRRNAHEKFCFKNPSRPSSQCPYCPMVLCNPMYIATHVRKVHGVDEDGKKLSASQMKELDDLMMKNLNETV